MDFGKYRLLEKIGQGGMAEVFYAHILGTEGFTKEVALKRVLSHLCEDADFVKSFIDEARLGGLLNHHHIVQTLDFGNHGGIFYLAMEYVHGLTLREILNYHSRQKRLIPPPVVLELALQLCEGLRYAHHAEDEMGNPLQMVHRDLKPTNIIVSSHGVVKIADFGIARADTNSRRTAYGGILKGTAQYMSPEQAYGDLSISQRSDIFSLGSIIFELITLKPLFYDPTSAVRTLRNVQEPQVDGPMAEMGQQWGYTRSVIPILQRMLSKSPEDRPSEVAEIIPALRRIQATISRLTDMQSWIEQILVNMGRPVKGRRSAVSRINIPVAPPATPVSPAHSTGDVLSQSHGDRAPQFGAPVYSERSTPTAGGVGMAVGLRHPDERTPVARLKELPGQPRIRRGGFAGEPSGEPALAPGGGGTSTAIGSGFDAEDTATSGQGELSLQEGEDTEASPPYFSGSVSDAGARSPGSDPGHPSDTFRSVPQSLPELPSRIFDPSPPSTEMNSGAFRFSPTDHAMPTPTALTPVHQISLHEDVSDPYAQNVAHSPGAILETTPAWLEPEDSQPSEPSNASGSADHGAASVPAKSSSGLSKLLFVAGGAVVVAVVLVFVGTRFIALTPSSKESAVRVTIDTIPGGAEVVFKDATIPSGHTPLTRSFDVAPSCLDILLRMDGYRQVERCLPMKKNGFLEPVKLEPASMTVGVLVYYPLDVKGLVMHVDQWELDLRPSHVKADQGQLRTFITRSRHNFRVKTDACDEISKEIDFSEIESLGFIKVVRESEDACAFSILTQQP